MLQMLAVKEDKWNVNDEGLCTLLGKGVKAVKSALAELVRHGYLFKYQVKDEQTKQFRHNQYDFYESPILNPHFGKSTQNEPDFFTPEPSQRKPSDGKAQLSTINPSKIKKQSRKVSQSQKQTRRTDFPLKKKNPLKSQRTASSHWRFFTTHREF